MPRSVGPVAAFVMLSFAACTRLNPAFGDEDETVADEASESDDLDTSSSDTEADSADTSTVGTSDTNDTNDTSDGPVADLPDENPACEGALGSPLVLKFTTPQNWLGACPPEPVVEGFLEFSNGGFVVRACDGAEGCSLDCQVFHPIDAAGFDFEPMLGSCVIVEAAKPLSDAPSVCSYSALSVIPTADLKSPFFVGTAASSGPTGFATEILDGWPQLHGDMNGPTPEAVCSCDSLAVESSCCVDGVDDVALYSFLLGGGAGIAQVGTHADYQLAGASYEYGFYNAMAQRVGSCGDGVIETSWKLFVTGGF